MAIREPRSQPASAGDPRSSAPTPAPSADTRAAQQPAPRLDLVAPGSAGGLATDYAALFNPGFRLHPARVALVVVDMQYASASREHGLGRFLAARGQSTLGAWRFDRIETVVVPTIGRLLRYFREHRLRIVYLTVGSELPDYSDLPAHMRPLAEAVGNTAGARAHEVLEALRPDPGEPVLNKTTMSAFHSSGLERLLRTWGVDQLLFCGVSTNSCVEGTARDAADRGFQCVLVEDGCGAASRALHDAACDNFGRLLGRVASADAMVREIEASGDPAEARGLDTGVRGARR